MRRIGRYVLFDEIASGGMASVHLGRLVAEAGFARIVAIKRLHRHLARAPEFVAMFTDEARLAARVRHPNVAATLDVLSEGGELFLVMEYVHGESLSRLWRASVPAGGVPAEIAAAVMVGALHGLHAAHEATSELGEPLGIVHRDVSPQNVLVDVDGVAHVLDFGIAKAALRLATTKDGQLKGKVGYMAPEQITGKSIDRRTDVYAASVVLWELLTARRLVDTADVGEAVTHIVDGIADRPSVVTPAIGSDLDGVVMRGLARDPGDRFATAREMAVALESAVRLASAREVGEWVRRDAEPRLADRARRIAELEAPAVAPASDAAPADDDRSQTPGSEAPTDVSRAPETPLPASHRLEPKPARARWPIVAGGASAIAIVAMVLASRAPSPPRSTVASAAIARPAPPPPEETRHIVPPATAAPTVSPSAEAAPEATASATSTAAARGGARRADCRPPYYLTKDGTKRFKPECL